MLSQREIQHTVIILTTTIENISDVNRKHPHNLIDNKGRCCMKTAVIYATRSGTAEKCSEKLSEMLAGESAIINIKKVSSPDLSGYDAVIVGSSIRIGKVQKEISEFVQKNLETLKEKRLGVFLCMGAGEENFSEYLSRNFPKEFLDKCKAKGFFGGDSISRDWDSFQR